MLAMGLALAASPAEAAPFAYVTIPGSKSISEIDTATNTVVATVTVGAQPVTVAVTPDGKRVYVTTISSNLSNPGAVLMIDTATNTVVATVTVGAVPIGVAITPDGKHAYVANSASTTVSVIDTTTTPPSVEATVPVGTSPNSVAVTPDGKHTYVTNTNDDTVSVIDTTSNTVVGTPIPVGLLPFGVAVTPDGKSVYVTNLGDNTVSVIATATNTVLTGPGFPIPVAIGFASRVSAQGVRVGQIIRLAAHAIARLAAWQARRFHIAAYAILVVA